MGTATRKAPQRTDVSYEDLYRRWEEGNWRTSELDFSQDRETWKQFSEIQRKSALWTYSMFFYGEDAVTDDLSPFIDALPKEEQKYFIATQQVDEARHAIFFHRFFNEVIGAEGDIGETLEVTREHHGWGYRAAFKKLDEVTDELRRDKSPPALARAITMYHMVVEGTLAQPGQHFIEDYFMKAGSMPGFSAGMKNVSRDEQRHIAFGVKVLSELLPQSEECREAVVDLLHEVMPYSLAVFIPPNFDRNYTRAFGFELEDIYAFGLRLVKRRWRAAGYPIDEMPPGVFPFDHTLPEEETAARQIKLMEAGVLGEPNGVPQSSPEVQRLLFELIARSAHTEEVGDRPMTIQWRFEDADPWHLVIDNGSSRAEAGEAAKADITLDTSWEQWIEIAVRGQDPRRAMLRRRLRPHGSPRKLLRLQRIFPSRPELEPPLDQARNGARAAAQS